MIDSTAAWNPIVFAFVFDHTELINHFKSRARLFDLKRCMQVPSLITVEDNISHSLPTDPKKGFQNFLTLLIENQSASLFALLDHFYYLVDFEDLIFMFSVLKYQKGDERYLILKDIIDSQAFKSIYMEEVRFSGFE